MLSGLMYYDDATAGRYLTPPLASAQSEFSIFPADFTKWGWIQKSAAVPDFDAYVIEHAIKGLGISTAKEDRQRIKSSHGDPHGSVPLVQQTHVVDGKTYRVSASNSTHRPKIGLTYFAGCQCRLQHDIQCQRKRWIQLKTKVTVLPSQSTYCWNIVMIITGASSLDVSGKLLTRPVTQDFPKLRKMPDIIFGTWTSVAGAQASNLRYVIV